ncbi:osteopetrosis-associated transmembrane protein 1 [Clarias gariepinus]|uniref:osteopetrosis-associated transmembrane protein 1 n=1 Tax=Clarias gariepinus TaxID=13013 RepID=UPI00234C5EEB|nr:osteopetrosis-associated transmembrane protein 1 [Clarias gariepinus]
MNMASFTSYSCVLCLVFLRSQTSVHAAEPGGDVQFKGNSYFASLSLSASSPEQLEITHDCLELLQDFGQVYANLSSCLVFNARPVRLCQNCNSGYNSLQNIYSNITQEMGPGNMSCEKVLLHSDRLMVVYNLYSSIMDIWEKSNCINCLVHQNSVSNTTLYFIDLLNQTRSCFEKYQQNHSELCRECRPTYKILNDLYSGMSKNNSLCIDVEDAMNVTRHLWSKDFNCSLTREENIPVIAVSSFMLFLPLIFYLSNYLHSEQKKRKLIHPKRAKSSHSLMNIQDKYS